MPYMRSFSNLPIMPKEIKSSMASHTALSTPYPTSAAAAVPRSAAIWNATDDEILLQARASGLNWQPIASRYFPNKTANACRKRHERLVERRQVEDWDTEKLESLAQEYLAVRKEMWEVLAHRMGERWSVVEAKCMEKGLKNLQAAARTGHRRAPTESSTALQSIEIAPNYRHTRAPGSIDEQGTATADKNSDSGIGFCSDAEMEVDGGGSHSRRTSSSWHVSTAVQSVQHQEHNRSRSLPQPLPLYQPPPPLNTHQRRTFDAPMTTSPAVMSYPGRPTEFQRYSPDFQNGRGGLSIQSMLSPADPLR